MVLPVPGGPQLRGDLVYLALDRLKPDERIELGQRALDCRRVGVAAESGREVGIGQLEVLAAESH